MCGAHSALGLEAAERESWPYLRERLRQPGRLMALMRGVLGGDAEVAAVAAVAPDGVTQPLALVVGPVIAAEITMTAEWTQGDRRDGRIGDYPVELIVDPETGERPIAVLMTPWMFENLTLFTRKLWRGRPADPGSGKR